MAVAITVAVVLPLGESVGAVVGERVLLDGLDPIST